MAHVFVARGTVTFEADVALGAGDIALGAGDIALGAGDAVRLTAAGAPSLTAGADGAEVPIWEMG